MVTVSGNPNPSNPTYPTNPTTKMVQEFGTTIYRIADFRPPDLLPNYTPPQL